MLSSVRGNRGVRMDRCSFEQGCSFEIVHVNSVRMNSVPAMEKIFYENPQVSYRKKFFMKILKSLIGKNFLLNFPNSPIEKIFLLNFQNSPIEKKFLKIIKSPIGKIPNITFPF